MFVISVECGGCLSGLSRGSPTRGATAATTARGKGCWAWSSEGRLTSRPPAPWSSRTDSKLSLTFNSISPFSEQIVPGSEMTFETALTIWMIAAAYSCSGLHRYRTNTTCSACRSRGRFGRALRLCYACAASCCCPWCATRRGHGSRSPGRANTPTDAQQQLTESLWSMLYS